MALDFRLRTLNRFMEHRGLVGVECPQCHWKHFMELSLDQAIMSSPAAKEIQRQLEEWLRSRCPDHLGAIMEKMKN